MSHQRYVVRVLGIPEALTKQSFEQDLLKQQVTYKSVWFATHSNGFQCAGFAFVEFPSKESMSSFLARYPLSQHNDVLWSSDDDKN